MLLPRSAQSASVLVSSRAAASAAASAGAASFRAASSTVATDYTLSDRELLVEPALLGARRLERGLLLDGRGVLAHIIGGRARQRAQSRATLEVGRAAHAMPRTARRVSDDVVARVRDIERRAEREPADAHRKLEPACRRRSHDCAPSARIASTLREGRSSSSSSWSSDWSSASGTHDVVRRHDIEGCAVT